MAAPLVSSLPRLDIAPHRGPWAWAHALLPRRARRKAFVGLIIDPVLDTATRLGRMRTLLDQGLWSAREQSDPASLARKDFNWAIFADHDRAQWCEAALHLALEAGMDPNMRFKSPRDEALLGRYARLNEEGMVRVLLQAGADPTWRDDHSMTALHRALENMTGPDSKAMTSQRIAKLLLDAGVDPNDPGQWRPHESREHTRRAPPMVSLAKEGHVGVMRFLLDRGAKLDVVDAQGHGAVHSWVVDGDFEREEFLREMIEKGAPWDEPDIMHDTPLGQALLVSDLSKARILVDAGAKLDQRSLVWTNERGITEKVPGVYIAELLLESGPPTENALYIAQRIQKAHPQCWSWPSSGEGNLMEFAQKHHPQWLAYLQGDTLQNDTPQALAPVRLPSRRL